MRNLKHRHEYTQELEARKMHEFRTCMAMLAGAFPDRNLTDNVLKAYSAGLSDCKEGLLYLTVQEVIKKAKFFPRIAEILEEYKHVAFENRYHRNGITYDGLLLEQLKKKHGADINRVPEFDAEAYRKKTIAYWENCTEKAKC